MSKGNPKITVRMRPDEIAHLRDVARLYGTDVSTFAREMFDAILSADVNKRLTWVHAMAVRLGEQMTLPLTEPARVARKARKKRRARDRTT